MANIEIKLTCITINQSFLFKDIKDVVTDCVEFSSIRHRHKSIAFPVFGTDGLGYPAEKVLEWIVEALADLCHSSRVQPHIDTVFVAIDEAETGASEIQLVGYITSHN